MPFHGSQAKKALGQRAPCATHFPPLGRAAHSVSPEISAMMVSRGPCCCGLGEKKHLLQFCIKPPTSCLISAESGLNRRPQAFHD